MTQAQIRALRDALRSDVDENEHLSDFLADGGDDREDVEALVDAALGTYERLG